MRRGEIWWASLPEPSGSGLGFRRPLVVISANSFNESRWDQADVGAVGDNAPVGVLRRYALHVAPICRTAVFVTRSHGGMGAGSREAFPYPE